MSDAIERLDVALEGRYSIEREIGQGGMATVYLARDPKHDRQVAIKVLNPQLSAIIGGERFLNEIRVTANLQHPHILALYDSGTADGLLYYVMPYVEGESLRQLLEREKQLGIEEAVAITCAVASALDYANRHGIVHRDIKPANILLHDGQPVVADFGIALALTKAGGARLTETGLSLGTPFYMSPEQATGDHVVDGRSDLYSLACVAYEMLTGEPPHTGATTQAVIARILSERPPPVTDGRPSAPRHVAAALSKALEKLPADRFVTAAEFSTALTTPGFAATRHEPSPGSAKRRPGWRLAGALAALTFAAGFGLGRTAQAPDATEGLGRFAIQLAPITFLSTGFAPQIALAPDGSILAFVGRGPRGNQIFVRAMSDSIPTPVSGTRGAQAAFFSQDGRRIGFWTPQRLQWVPVEGGTPTLIADSASYFATWTDRGDLVYTDMLQLTLRIVEPDGSTREIAQGGDSRFQAISPLPGGDNVLVTLLSGGRNSTTVVAVSLADGTMTEVGLPDVLMARYVGDGLVVYQRRTGGPLMTAPFDLGSMTVTGQASSVAPDARVTFRVMPQWDASGPMLAYVPPAPSQLVTVDRVGRETVIQAEPRTYHHPRFSPDGERVAFDITDSDARDIWIADISDGTMSRLTVGEVANDPFWSPDGSRLVFTTALGPQRSVGIRNADGSGATEIVHGDDVNDYSSGSWAPDGSSLVVSTALVSGLWTVPLDGSGEPAPISGSRPTEAHPALSPDGRWLAYVSDDSGRQEVFVRPYPGPGGRQQISVNGGSGAAWTRDGRELLFREDSGVGARMMSAAIRLSPTFEVLERTPLFAMDNYLPAEDHANYDLHPDGNSFVLVRSRQPGQIQLVQNWRTQLPGR